MNIDFNKIAEFCVTKNQKKKIAILQKKFSFLKLQYEIEHSVNP